MCKVFNTSNCKKTPDFKFVGNLKHQSFRKTHWRKHNLSYANINHFLLNSLMLFSCRYLLAMRTGRGYELILSDSHEINTLILLNASVPKHYRYERTG